MEVTTDMDIDGLTPIEEENARISIPREVLEGATGETPVRMASFLFRNMSGLLPESLNDGAQNFMYVDGISKLSWLSITHTYIIYYLGIKRIVYYDWPLQLSLSVSNVTTAPL